MRWKAKGLIQKTLSLLPGGCRCNHFLQKNIGQLRGDANIHGAFREDVSVLFERIAQLGLDPRDSRILEIGTGWLPVFPLSLALAGFRNIHTVDIYPHLRPAAARRTLLALQAHLDDPALLLFTTPDAARERFDRFLRSDDVIAATGIVYDAPANATSTRLPPGSLDLITSNNVLEHVPHPVLLDLFAEGKRLLGPGGRLLHCVNCGDHYAYADPKVTQANYLQYTSEEWSRWNNSIQFQNRLRPMDFTGMADGYGFRVDSAEFTPNPKALKQIETMQIAPEFRHYPIDQLASTSLTLIASA